MDIVQKPKVVRDEAAIITAIADNAHMRPSVALIAVTVIRLGT
jgi:hypothetical protein